VEGAGFSGRIQDFPLRGVLQMICLSSRTGTLSLQRPGATGRIDFENGNIIRAATSLGYNNLGDLLIHSGRLTQASLDQVVRQQRQATDAVPLGSLLVQAGLITRGDLQEVMRNQVQEVVLQLLQWTDGMLSFQATLSPAVDDIALGTADVLRDAAISTSILLKETAGMAPTGPAPVRATPDPASEGQPARLLYATRGGRRTAAREAIATHHVPVALLDLGNPAGTGATRSAVRFGPPATLVLDLTDSGRHVSTDAARAVDLIRSVAPDRTVVLHHGLSPAVRRQLCGAGVRAFVDVRADRGAPCLEVMGSSAGAALTAALHALDDLRGDSHEDRDLPAHRHQAGTGRS